LWTWCTVYACYWLRVYYCWASRDVYMRCVLRPPNWVVAEKAATAAPRTVGKRSFVGAGAAKSMLFARAGRQFVLADVSLLVCVYVRPPVCVDVSTRHCHVYATVRPHLVVGHRHASSSSCSLRSSFHRLTFYRLPRRQRPLRLTYVQHVSVFNIC